MAETFPTPTETHVAYLRENPGSAESFDGHFGAGSSASFLTEGDVTGPEGPGPALVAPNLGRLGAGLPPKVPEQAAPPVEEEGTSILDNILEVPGAIASGVLEAGKEIGEFGISALTGDDVELDREDGTRAALESLPLVGSVVKNFFPEEVKDRASENLTPDRPETITGQFTESVSQFITGFAAVGGVGGGLGVGLTAGAISAAIAFDPDDGNLQNFLEENDWAIPVVTDALATDPEDPQWEKRLKNSVDGLMGDVALMGFVKMIKAYSLYAKGKHLKPLEGDALRAQANDLARQAVEDTQASVVHAEEAAAKAKSNAPITEVPEGKGGYISPEDLKERARAFSEAIEAGPGGKVVDDAATRQTFVEGARLKEAVARAGDITPDELAQSTEWFNYRKMDGPIEGQQVIAAMGEALEGSGAFKKFGLDKPETLGTTLEKAKAELADMAGIGLDGFNARLQDLAETGINQAKTIVAGKMALQTLGKEISTLAARVDNAVATGNFDEALEVKLFNLMETHSNVQLHLKAAQTSAARATSAGRIRTTDGLDLDALAKIEASGGSARLRRQAAMLRQASGPKQVASIVRNSKFRTTIDVINEVWINSILSGVKTNMVNFTSNAINLALLPGERIGGGIIQGVRGQGFKQAREGLLQYAAYRTSFLDSARMAGRAFREERSILDVGSTKLDPGAGGGRKKAVTAKTFGLADNSVGGATVNAVGKFARLPSRFLMTADEFAKQMSFRSRLNAHLTVASGDVDLKALGYKSRGDFVIGEELKAVHQLDDLNAQWAKMVEEGRVPDEASLKEAFIKDNIGSINFNNPAAVDALRTARAATFTTELDPDSLMGSLQKAAVKHPGLRQVIPFIQTPANILAAGVDRTPVIGLLRSRFRAALKSPDAAVRAEAQGKLATGVVLVAATSVLAMEGRITGGGPVDPKMRRLWQEDSGWQPYSFNMGSAEDPTWVAFNRLDPHGFLFGIVADIQEMRQASLNDPTVDTSSYLAMVMTAAANNVVSKTWVKGISDVVEVLTSKDRPDIAERWLKTRVASFVPMSSFGRQFNEQNDSTQREVRTYLDHVMANIPGYSSELAARFSWLTGESMDRPSYWAGFLQVKNGGPEPVEAELRRLNFAFSGPDKRIGDIELSPEIYQEYRKLMGSVKKEGRTLKERLLREMQTDRYDLARDKVADGQTAPSESHRVRAMAKHMERYKKKAKRQLLENHPELADAVRAEKQFKTRAKYGRAQPGERENLLLKF